MIRSALSVMRLEALLVIFLMMWMGAIEVNASNDSEAGEVTIEMPVGKTVDLIMMSLCDIQSEQFGKIVRLRIETNSLAEVSFQCFLNGGFGNTDEGKAQYKTLQQAYEIGVSKGTPTEQCNFFRDMVFELIEDPSVAHVDDWVQEGKNFWFKTCMERVSD